MSFGTRPVLTPEETQRAPVFDIVVSQTVASPTWFPHPTVFELAVNSDGNYAFPVAGVRLTVNSGGGTATLTLIQAGIA